MLILPIGVLAVLFVMSSVPGGSRPAGGKCDTLLPVSAVSGEEGHRATGGVGERAGIAVRLPSGGILVS